MPKILITHFLILALFTVSLQTPISAQSQPATNANVKINLEEGSVVKSDFRKMLDERSRDFQRPSKEFDPKRAEREERARQVKPDHWSKKKTVLIVVLVTIGAAVGIYFLAKYAKDCIKTDPPGCDPFSDESCTCTEYAPRKH